MIPVAAAVDYVGNRSVLDRAVEKAVEEDRLFKVLFHRLFHGSEVIHIIHGHTAESITFKFYREITLQCLLPYNSCTEEEVIETESYMEIGS